MLADLGFGGYCFSLEWSRIEAEEGEWSPVALDHYRRMCAGCLEAATGDDYIGVQTYTRRHRRPRLLLLERAGQLRVGLRLPADRRADRRRPPDPGAHAQAERGLARRGGERERAAGYSARLIERARRALWLAALFLWMTPLLTALS
jgi:hypothetical protein